MSSSAFLRRTFGEKERHGKPFYEKLSLPTEYKDKLLHGQIIATGKVPTQKALNQSYGFRVPDSVASKTDNVFDITCHEDLRPVDERNADLDSQFAALNDPTLSQKQRLDLWDSMEPGFVLALFGGSDSTAAGIGCFSCPVCTQSTSTGDAFGAPDWTDVFVEEVCKAYLGESVDPTHCLVGSLAHNSWEFFMQDSETMIEGLLPVVMPDGKAIGRRPNNGKIFQMLLFPSQGEAPVGVFMDAATTFDEYKAAFDGKRAYKNFNRLLTLNPEVFQAWFDAVNAQPAVYKVPLMSALPLWKTFPSAAKKDGEHLVGVDELGPFLEQKSRFLRAMTNDMICRAPMGTTPGEGTARCMYRCWRDRAMECYPTELGIQRPISRQAYLEELLPPDGGWPNGFSLWSDVAKLDSCAQLPANYACYKAVDIPIGADDPEGWVATRLVIPAPAPAVEDLSAFRKRRAVQSSKQPITPATTVPVTAAAPAVTVSPKKVPNVAQRPSVGVRQLSQLFQAEAATGVPGVQGTNFLTLPGIMDPNQAGFQPTPMAFQQQGGMSSHTALDLESPAQKRLKATRFGDQGGMPPHWQTPQQPPGVSPYGSYAAMAGMQEAQVFSPGRAAMFAHPNTGYGAFGPQVIMAHGPLAGAKHARVQESKITSPELRRKCSTTYLQICLMMVYPVQKGYNMVTRSGRTMPSDDLLYVRAPSSPTGIKFLMGLDHGNSGEDAAAQMRSAMKIRWVSESTLVAVSLPAHQWQSKITAEFVIQGFRQSDWSMNADYAPPSKSDKKHSLLKFLPLLGDEFSEEFVPAGGMERCLLYQWSRFIYYFYSMPGCKTSATVYGSYDDTSFMNSEFGMTLMLMCRLIQNPALERLWRLRQEQCTVTYIRDMSTLFELLGEFLEHRAGMSIECCGLDEAAFEGALNSAVVVPATMLPNAITGQPSNFITKLEVFRTRMTETWGKDRYNEYEAHWATPSSSLLLKQSNRGLPPLIQRPSGHYGRENEPLARERPERSTPVTPSIAFTNRTPLYEYVGAKPAQNAGQMLIPLVVCTW